jgi:4-amino-4-deoxy-L-arabinose transferase-like glycosyltransferase
MQFVLNERNHKAILFALSLVFFYPFLGRVHLFDWDEINFAEIAREMIVSGDYLRPQINFQPFWEKPPLFIWLQVLSMKIFGINEFAARFPNALIGTVTILTVHQIGKNLLDSRFGFYWALGWMGSILPHLYFKSGIIDPLFNLLIFVSVHFFILFFILNKLLLHLCLSASLLALAILTKGPAALLIFGLSYVVFVVVNRFKLMLNFKEILVYVIVLLLVTALWYGIEVVVNGPFFITEFFKYQVRLFQTKDAGHGGFPGYHFVILLFGCFPSSVFALQAMFRNDKNVPQRFRSYRQMMLVLFWVVLILFSVVSTKIVHYSSLCYFPITFLSAAALHQITEQDFSFSPRLKTLFWVCAFVFALATAFLPLVFLKPELVIPTMKDPFAVLAIQAEFTKPLYLFALPVIILAVVILFGRVSRKKISTSAVLFLFGGMALSIGLVLILFVGRIEMMSQNASVVFIEKYSRDGIVQVYGFKSYAHLYYGKVQPPGIPTVDELLQNPQEKPVYLLCKVNNEEALMSRKDVEKIEARNGFVVFRKK